VAKVIEAARHIDVGRRRFFELLDDGVIARKPLDEYDLDEVRLQYIRHLRKVAAGRGVDNDIYLSAERALLARQQTENMTLKNAIVRGEYVLMGEVVRQVENNFVVIRQRLLVVSGKVSDGVAGQSRDVIAAAIDREIVEALNELSEPSLIGERAAEKATK
jgi:phage terminase Nu1 subunit (DNA packaging protein)